MPCLAPYASPTAVSSGDVAGGLEEPLDRKDDVGPPQKKAYEAPRIREWGTVADLTRIGATQDLGDVKDGSNFPPAEQ